MTSCNKNLSILIQKIVTIILLFVNCWLNMRSIYLQRCGDSFVCCLTWFRRCSFRVNVFEKNSINYIFNWLVIEPEYQTQTFEQKSQRCGVSPVCLKNCIKIVDKILKKISWTKIDIGQFRCIHSPQYVIGKVFLAWKALATYFAPEWIFAGMSALMICQVLCRWENIFFFKEL